MGVIEWIPVAEAPEALKDGRDVLAWDDCAVVSRWETYSTYGAEGWGDNQGWLDEYDLPILPTHLAEINPPEGERP